MATEIGFHPEARLEYLEETRYYLREAAPGVAERFTAIGETALARLVSDPVRWPVVEAPEMRRCVLKRFPFVIYYRWESCESRVTVFALMHCSRKPAHWLPRVQDHDRA